MINQDIKPTGIYSAYVDDKPFDLALAELQAAGYTTPVSAKENARLRIQEGKDAYISRNGNWTREGFIYAPGSDRVTIAKVSPILTNPSVATEAHRNGKEVYISSIPTEGTIQIPYNQRAIPTDRFPEEDLTAFLFGDVAQDSGLFLKEAGIKQMPIWLVTDKNYINRQDKPFARQCWFGRLVDGSELVGYRNLYCNNRLRGVRHAEGDAQKLEQEIEKLVLEGLQGANNILSSLIERVRKAC